MKFVDVNGDIIDYQEGEKIDRRPSAYGIIIKNNKFLCIRPVWNNKKYALPGGAIEIGESPIDCLEREFLEETGYKIKVVNQQPIYFKDSLFFSGYNKKYWHSLLFFYEVELESEIQECFIESGKETLEIIWKDISHISMEEFSYFQREFLLSYLKK